MINALRTLVEDYGWIHTAIGVCGNAAFFLGSIAFLPTLKRWDELGVEWQTVGVWLFIFGAFFMLIGAVGNLLVKALEAQNRRASKSSS
jgi:hypothetical protein